MADQNSLHFEPQKKGLQQEHVLDLKKIFYLIVSNWYYFTLALSVALICAYFYNASTIPTYRVSTTLLIDEEKKGDLLGNNQLFEGNLFGAAAKNLDNQIMVLSSKTLIGRALDKVDFNIEYYHTGLFNKISLYPNHPINVVPLNVDSLPRDIEFTFKYLNNNNFILDAESKGSFEMHIQASFGKIIKTPHGRFYIEIAHNLGSSTYLDPMLKFKFHSRDKLVESYRKQMKVEKVSKTGTILTISLEGTNKTMNIEFLNRLTEIFRNSSLDKKNLEAIRTIQFIDDQLIGISDSLILTENKLQQFRSKNRVMDLSKQGQVIINQAMSLENEKVRLGIEANYYNYLADYLAKDNAGQAPIAPATMGITDPGLTKLVADLAVLQGQYYSKSLGEKNPLQSQLGQRVRITKEALKETLNGVRKANNMSMSEINDQIRTVNAQASALPVTERQLLGIERKYKLNDALYTFLLEKRAGAQIQKASNMPDNEVIDPAEADVLPVKPKKLLIYFLALIAGIGIPLLLISIANGFNNNLREDDDIKKITDIPITGHIPHSLLKKDTIVLDKPHTYVAEAFRSLTSKMQFFIKVTKVPVILITSSMPEEGKTFTAINLASVYSLMGKKTVLVGFDLRRPKIYSDFKLDNLQGVSTWLIGKDELKDIIKETCYENLSIIPSGPIPPNPYELTALKKTDELIILLKEMFDCIIIDSSPIGTVSDAFHLATLSDTCVLVARQKKTSKNLFDITLKELKASDINSISVVVNDVKHGGLHYGYAGKYGSSYGKVKNEK